MPSIQKILLFIASACFLILVLRLMRKRHLSTKYSLLWIALGIVGLLAAAFPVWVFFLSDLLGFELPANFIFFICTFFLLSAVFAGSVTGSEQAEAITTLTQEISLLKQRVEILEKEQADSKE